VERPAYRLVEHTADMAFEVEAPDWPGLLARAVLALSDVIRRLEGPAEERRDVRVERADREEVLVALLDEVVYLFERDGFLPVSVTVSEATATSAAATLSGSRHDPRREPPDRVVKAATHHDLRVEEGVEGKPWRTRVVLDL
jgi:SHS2 domain-containing protein